MSFPVGGGGDVVSCPTCNDCGKQFMTKRNLIRHQNRKNPCVIKCRYCGKVFKSNIQLKTHRTALGSLHCTRCETQLCPGTIRKLVHLVPVLYSRLACSTCHDQIKKEFIALMMAMRRYVVVPREIREMLLTHIYS